MSDQQSKENQEVKKVLRVKKWTITLTTFDDGTSEMTRINEGFTPFELMGISEFSSMEVREQIIGTIRPDKVKREVVISPPNA